MRTKIKENNQFLWVSKATGVSLKFAVIINCRLWNWRGIVLEVVYGSLETWVTPSLSAHFILPSSYILCSPAIF